jgi:hypothetical protein
VRTVAATPHVRPDFPAVVTGEVGRRTARLQAAADAAGIDVALVPSGDVDVLSAQRATDGQLREVVLRRRGSDLPVPRPYSDLPAIFEQWLGAIAQRGFCGGLQAGVAEDGGEGVSAALAAAGTAPVALAPARRDVVDEQVAIAPSGDVVVPEAHADAVPSRAQAVRAM